jgi:iron(III) transport system permease protein
MSVVSPAASSPSGPVTPVADAIVPAFEPTGGPDKTRRRRAPVLLTALGLVVAIGALLPLAYLVLRAIDAGGAQVWSVVTDPRTLILLRDSLLLTVAVTATTIAIAVPLAWLTVRSDLPARRILTVLTGLPLAIPTYVGGFAFVAFAGPRGVLQSWLEPLGIERLPSIYGFGGAWLVLSLFTYPYVLLTVRSSLRRLDPSLEEAARTLGSTPLEVFRRITLPQLRPAIAAGGLLVSLYTLSDFGAVSLLRFDSFTRAIYDAYRSSIDRSTAAVLGLMLVALTVVVVALELRSRGRTSYHGVHAGSSRTPPVAPLGPWRWPAFAACSLLALVALGLPAGVITYWLVRGLQAGEPFRLTAELAGNSVTAAALGTVLVVLAAWPVALLSVRHRNPTSRFVELATWVGHALPGVVVALSLVFFGARVTPALYQTMVMLVFAYAVLFLPQAMGAMRASLLQVNPELEEASRSLGRGPAATFRRIVVPLVRPGVLAGGALVFLTIMKELPATLLLAPTGYRTLATQVWSATSEALFGRAAAPALALILLASLPMVFLVMRDRDA